MTEDKSFIKRLPSPKDGPSKNDGNSALFDWFGHWREPAVFGVLRHGLMLTLPLLLVAAIALLVNNFPLEGYASLMQSIFGPNWRAPGTLIYNCSIGIISLVVAYNLSSSLIDWHNTTRRSTLPISKVLGSGVVFCCIFIMLGPHIDGRVLTVSWVGIGGLLGTYIVTLGAGIIFLWLCGFQSLTLRYYSEGSDPLLPQIFSTVIPAILTIFIIVGLKFILSSVGITSIHHALHEMVLSLFRGGKNSLPLGLAYTGLVQLSWFFGVHGANFFDPVTHDIFGKGLEINARAVQAGDNPPYVLTKYLFDQFLYLGGSGATLALIAAIFIKSRDTISRRIASISLLPGIFNINELIIFGLPVAFNPVYLIPFMLAPMAMLIISYFAVGMGLVPPPVYHVDWTTPIFINAWLSTKSIAGVLLQAVNLGVATLIYIPFVSIAEKGRQNAHRKAFDALVKVAESGVKSAWGKNAIDRTDRAGSLARSLANDLVESMDKQKGDICLYYQPRVDMLKKTVPAAEALLRWTHPVYGSIPAVVTSSIAEDAGLADRLDSYILDLALQQARTWKQKGLNTAVTVNLSQRQLDMLEFPGILSSKLLKYELEPDAIRLEVKESIVLNPDNPYEKILNQLKNMGILISVDAFGQGYQALLLLRHLPFSELQLDKKLTLGMLNTPSYQEVIASILEHSIALNIRTTAEFVESEEQLESLMELNLTTFQGQLFANPGTAEECEAFINSFGK